MGIYIYVFDKQLHLEREFSVLVLFLEGGRVSLLPPAFVLAFSFDRSIDPRFHLLLPYLHPFSLLFV